MSTYFNQETGKYENFEKAVVDKIRTVALVLQGASGQGISVVAGVRYDTDEQGLTDTQKKNARANIAAQLAGQLAAPFDPEASYFTNALVEKDGVLYRMTADDFVTGDWDPDNWQVTTINTVMLEREDHIAMNLATLGNTVGTLEQTSTTHGQTIEWNHDRIIENEERLGALDDRVTWLHGGVIYKRDSFKRIESDDETAIVYIERMGTYMKTNVHAFNQTEPWFVKLNSPCALAKNATEADAFKTPIKLTNGHTYRLRQHKYEDDSYPGNGRPAVIAHGGHTVISTATQDNGDDCAVFTYSTSEYSDGVHFVLYMTSPNNSGSNAITMKADYVLEDITETPVEIPQPPTEDGTYTLKVTMADGVPTYTWAGDGA